MAKKIVLIFVLLLALPFAHGAHGDDERRLAAAVCAEAAGYLHDDGPVLDGAEEAYQEEEQFDVEPGGFHAPQDKAYDVVVELVRDRLAGIDCSEEEVRLAVQLCLDERDWGMLGHLFKQCPGLQWFFIGVDASGCSYNLLREMAERAGCLSVCIGVLAEFPVLQGIDRVRGHLL